MSLVHVINGVDVTDRLEFDTIRDLTTAARGGERGGGTVIVTDRTGSLNLRGWHTYHCNETLCTSRPRVFAGFLAGKEIKRGPEGPIGVGRVWECQLNDLNAVFHLQLLRGATWKRPAEDNLTRLDALLAEMADLIEDTGYVERTNPRPFEEADYRDGYPDQVMDDIIPGDHRDYFAFWDDVAAAVSLFYDLRSAAILSSTLSISNVAGDADYATVFPTGNSVDTEDATVTRDPDEVYSGVVYKYAHGEVYRHDATTEATFFPDLPGGRDAVYDNSRIGLLSSAIHFAEIYLEAHSVERDTVTIPVRLPADKVNLIQAGDRVQVRLEHEPGYTSYTWIRVSARKLSEGGLGTDNVPQYDVVLTCTNNPPAGGGGGGAPGSDGFPQQPPPAPVNFYSGSLAFHTDGYGTAHVTGTGAVIPNRTDSSTNTAAVTFQNGVTYDYSFTITLIGGDNPPSVGLLDQNGAAIGFGMPVITGTGSGVQTFTGTFTPSADVSNAYAFAGAGALGHPVGGRAAALTWIVNPVGWDDGSTPVPPAPLKPVGPEIVSMSGANGTLDWSFTDGSLRVWVDNLEETAAITAQDGAAGTFTLGFTPKAGEVVTATYLGR